MDGISKNVPYKLVTIDLPSSPTGDMLTADLEIVTPLSGQSGRMLKFETQPNLPQVGGRPYKMVRKEKQRNKGERTVKG